GATLINNGVIRAGGGNPLHFRQFGGGLYDLDGTNAAGAIDLSTHADARLRLQGTGLTDSFSGRITMRGGARLDMDLTDGWVANAFSEIDVLTNLSGPAYIEGDGALTLAGRVSVHGDGWLNIDATSVAFAPTFDLNVETNNAFTVQAPTVVEGGTFTMAPSGTVRFDGTTTLRGGLFDAQDGYTVTGGTTFFGDVVLDGVVNVSGTMRTFGDVSTAGTSTINADYLLMSPQEF